jgi:tetratricopeptide (TPR) repeat protein
MTTTRSRLFRAVLLASIFAAMSATAANPYVVLPDGRKVEGTEVRASREGIIYLTTAAGRVEYPKGTKVVMDQPAELIRAISMLQKQQFNEAIPVLEKVIEESRYLGWDMNARKWLASAYNGKQEWKKAVESYESLMADFKDIKEDEGVRSGYLQALAGNGDTEKVMPLLQTAIATGSRSEAATAQMIRGRIRFSAGDVESALYDFMRTARFFREFKELAAEGAFRSAECLEKLGDVERAGEYYKQVAQDYPDSSFAVQAKVKAGVKP